MNKEQLWKILTDKNPCFLTGPVNFTPNGLKKMFDTIFDQAHDQGFRNGKAAVEMKKKRTPEDSFAGFMDDLTGMKMS